MAEKMYRHDTPFDRAYRTLSERGVKMRTSEGSYRMSGERWSFHGHNEHTSETPGGTAAGVTENWTLKSDDPVRLKGKVRVSLPHEGARTYDVDVTVTQDAVVVRARITAEVRRCVSDYWDMLYRIIG